ncbi:MAG: ABC transporter substrate-binding protein [Anaerolineales bacterium]|nr:ABC transporter substrate-binding protein [Anaerolineales bacterium]MCX7755707.1 ABC transporter substrate-binding protein [Anaerolineales bacterium]MDW8277692.1 ABC transporter substrate-binding protein [Anaerolineales bacterium]
MKRITLLFVVLAMLLAACGAPVTPQSQSPVVLRVGWLGFPDTLNPAYAFLSEAYTIFDLVYSTLLTEGPNGKYMGSLAEAWNVSDDGLRWTFTLRPNIRWHNGEALTIEQVVWNFNTFIQNPDGWVTNSGYVKGFKEARALDERTLQIELEYPISNMEFRVAFLYIVYPKDFESFATPEELQNFTNFNPVGTGAFKINTLDKDQRVILLDTNPDYFDGRAKIDQVIYRTFDNSDALIQALRVGDIDLAVEVPNSAFDAVKQFQGVTAISLSGRSLTELILNSVPEDHDPPPNRNPAITDPVVRLAIAKAINKQDLVDVVLQGHGIPGVSIIPPTLGGGFWFNRNIQDVTFDLDEASRLLEEAGYLLQADGVRAKDGVRLEFRLQYPSDSSNYPRAADMIATWLGKIGIRATPAAVDPDSLMAAVTPNGDYDLVIWGWGSDPDPDFMLSVMTSEQYVEGGWSDSGYSNPVYDELFVKQQKTLDENERQKIVWEMQEIVFNDRPYIVLWYDNTLQAYRSDRFVGFLTYLSGIDSFKSLMNVEPVK